MTNHDHTKSTMTRHNRRPAQTSLIKPSPLTSISPFLKEMACLTNASFQLHACLFVAVMGLGRQPLSKHISIGLISVGKWVVTKRNLTCHAWIVASASSWIEFVCRGLHTCLSLVANPVNFQPRPKLAFQNLFYICLKHAFCHRSCSCLENPFFGVVFLAQAIFWLKR